MAFISSCLDVCRTSSISVLFIIVFVLLLKYAVFMVVSFPSCFSKVIFSVSIYLKPFNSPSSLLRWRSITFLVSVSCFNGSLLSTISTANDFVEFLRAFCICVILGDYTSPSDTFLYLSSIDFDVSLIS